MLSQTVSDKLNQSDTVAGCSNEEVYCGIFENRPSKFIAIVFSATLISLNTILLGGMIWYERFGSDIRRTLMNKIFASVCWAALAHNLHTGLEILRFIIGPCPQTYCFLQFFLKVSATSVFLLFYDAIVITKYILIFWLKNPGAVNDGFWWTFINVYVCMVSILYDGSRYFLPGKLNFPYYICSGTSPASHIEMPKMGGIVVETFTVVLHIVCMIRIVIYKIGKLEVPVCHSFATCFRAEYIVTTQKSTIATVSNNLIIVLSFSSYIYYYDKVKTMNYLDYNLYPNYLYTYFHLLVWTPLIIFLACSLYYIRHHPLRQAMIREFNVRFR